MRAKKDCICSTYLDDGRHYPGCLVTVGNMIGSFGEDPVAHPPHYTAHPSKIECIQITEHMSFCLGNAIKYIWRADLKGEAVEDLQKARWYVDREIQRRKGER